MTHATAILECFRKQTFEHHITKLEQHQIANYRQASYVVHRSWHAVNVQMGAEDEGVISARWLMDYEIDERFVFEQRIHLPLIYDCFDQSLHRSLLTKSMSNNLMTALFGSVCSIV
mmetsp:Transcript_26538/g.49288  ORF Transcript_26538/g.49288 Transcript_26538/m.49288 type:complete len:116 (-) Transcript_26538:224-571(-)